MYKKMMHITIKTLAIIFFLFIIAPIVSASQISYNEDKIPIFELNNSPLIETIMGRYIDSNNSSLGGNINDYDDGNINLDYYYFERKGFPIDDKEVGILEFGINYKIKNNVEYLIPFSFNLGEWPKLLYIIDDGINVEITNINTGNSSLLIYGKNKSILISKLPPPFEYTLNKQNESTILSISGRNMSAEGRFAVELKVTEYTPLELSRVNSFKEYSVISLENEKVKLQTDFYKDFDYPVSSIIYFEDPEKTEKPFSNESILEFQAGFFKTRNMNFTSIINDSEKLLLIMPFPNMVISEPINVVFYNLDNFYAFMFNPFQVQRLNIKNYEKRIDIVNLDRYIFPLSYLEDPEITFLPNKTIIIWNYSQIETPLALIGIINETKSNSQKIASSGNRILIVKPESKKYFSKEIVNINPPINKNDPPNQFEIIRYDTRYPLKSKIPIPLMLDTSSDAYVEYIKVNGNNLMGPWELKPNLSLEEGKYYSLKTPKNTLSILFAVNTSNSINVELKYTKNAIEKIEKVNSYTWKYSMYELYPIGDIPDYKQIYNIVLPMQYSFSDIPPNALRQRTQDGRDQITLEYNQSVRYRYINFSISSENLKEKHFPYNVQNFLSLSWVIENISILILGGLFTVSITFVANYFDVFKKIKDRIERK